MTPEELRRHVVVAHNARQRFALEVSDAKLSEWHAVDHVLRRYRHSHLMEEALATHDGGPTG